MVRMGSPVRFRRGAPPQHRRSGRVRHRPVAGLSAVNRRLPEICQIDLITLSRYAIEELDAVDLAPAGPCPGSPSLIRGRTNQNRGQQEQPEPWPEQARPLQAPAVGGPRARHPPRHPLAVPPCPAGLHSHCWPAVPSACWVLAITALLLAHAEKMGLAAFNPWRCLCRVLRVRWPARWEVQMAQLLVFDIDSAQTAQAIHRVVGW
jgi:hypothetical protein